MNFRVSSFWNSNHPLRFGSKSAEILTLDFDLIAVVEGHCGPLAFTEATKPKGVLPAMKGFNYAELQEGDIDISVYERKYWEYMLEVP
jgi:hypothetical protein